MIYPTDPNDAVGAGGAFVVGGGSENWGQDYTESAVRSMFAIPAPTPFTALDLMRQQLEKLPLEALQLFKDLIPDPIEEMFETVGGAIDAIMGALVTPITTLLQAAVDLLTNMWNQFSDLVQGIIITPINDAMSAVNDWWSQLGDKLSDGIEQAGQVVDDLWSGLMRTLGIGKSSADVANAANQLSEQALNAIDLGEWNNAILGIRNNKSIMEGIDETEESTFLMSDLFTGAATPPLINVTSSAVPIAFWRASEWSKKGFISWFGEGFSGITAMYVDIYKFNYTTNTLELIHTSPDVSGLADATWKYIVYYLDEADRFEVFPGDVIGIGLRVEGAGTHKLGAKSAPWLPAHPTVVPAKPAATRTGSGNLAFGSITYATDIPWFGIGIVQGDTPPLFYTPRTTAYSSPGSFTYTIPSWAKFVDVTLVGAGGGGCRGNAGAALHGEGGEAGSWLSETLERGVDFPVGATSLTIVVGAGGGKGDDDHWPGYGGAASYRAAIASGKAQITAAGGAGGDGFGLDTNYIQGDSPGNHTYGGTTFIGGARSPSNAASEGGYGRSPGGGGGGGAGGWFGLAWDGGAGGNGGAWVTARQS